MPDVLGCDCSIGRLWAVFRWLNDRRLRLN